MPQRFLKPGLLTSRRWNSLSWDAQSFYIRLIMLVDDYGRMEADERILKSFAFPMYPETASNPQETAVTCQQVAALCRQLANSGLAVFFEANDGNQYVQLTNWSERARGKAKYPEFTKEFRLLHADDSNPQESAGNCSGILPPSFLVPRSSPSVPRSTPSGVESADRPSLSEVVGYASTIGLATWKAEDWWQEMEGCGWIDHNRREVRNWQRILDRVRTKWEADGRPKTPPTNYANNRNSNTGGVDRSKGTFNEGKHSTYGKLKPRHV